MVLKNFFGESIKKWSTLEIVNFDPQFIIWALDYVDSSEWPSSFKAEELKTGLLFIQIFKRYKSFSVLFLA